MAIVSFRDRRLNGLFERGSVAASLPNGLVRTLRQKLDILHAADRLEDLRVPPGNRLEALRGDRDGQHSIRVNVQWRLCFRWTESGPADVELVDYH